MSDPYADRLVQENVTPFANHHVFMINPYTWKDSLHIEIGPRGLIQLNDVILPVQEIPLWR